MAKGEVGEVVRGARAPVGAAYDRNWCGSVLQQLEQGLDGTRIRLLRHRRNERPIERLHFVREHVLGQRKHDRPRTACRRYAVRAVDIFRNPAGVLNPCRPFADRAEEGGKVDFLEALAVAVAAGDIADEEDHRSRVLEGDVHAGAGVGRSRPARDEGDSGTTGHLPVRVGHIGDAALLPADGKVDLGCIVQRVEDGEEAFARDREDAIASLDPKLIDEDAATSALGHGAPVSRLVAHRQRVVRVRAVARLTRQCYCTAVFATESSLFDGRVNARPSAPHETAMPSVQPACLVTCGVAYPAKPLGRGETTMTATTPPSGGGETLAPKPATTTGETVKETFILGGETVEPSTIRPFSYRASDDDLADLKRRIAATRWPGRELVDDASQGVQLATIQKLADYWLNDHDWRTVEAKINSYPNFVTSIDGVDIHFIHVKSSHPNALPVIITHGWPGSVIEQLKIIEPLTDPTAYGGRAEDAFDVVIPSMPGYGFSGKPSKPGWGPERIASTWDVLMKRLGMTVTLPRAAIGAP